MILLNSPEGNAIWFSHDGPDRTFMQAYRPESGWDEEETISPRVARVMIPSLTNAGWIVSSDSPCTVFEFSELLEEIA